MGRSAGKNERAQPLSPLPLYSGGEGPGVRGPSRCKGVPSSPPTPLPPEYRGERGGRKGPALAKRGGDLLRPCWILLEWLSVGMSAHVRLCEKLLWGMAEHARLRP